MSAENVLKFIKEKEAEFVDLRFTDPRGKLQHLTMDASIVDADMLNEGVFFDGSSIAGWKAINESDMILKPDTARMFMDPFTSHNTVVLFCDILDAIKKEVEDSKKLFKKNNWPVIDVTRRSVEETAASILKIIDIKRNK